MGPMIATPPSHEGQTAEVSFDSPLSHPFSLQEISLLASLSVSSAPAHVSLQALDPTGSSHLFSAGFSLLVSPLKPLPPTAVSQQLKGFCFRFNFQKKFLCVCDCLCVRMCACACAWGPTEDMGALGMASPSLHPQRDFVRCWFMLSSAHKRTTLWNLFSPSTFIRAPETESAGLCHKLPYPLSHLAGPCLPIYGLLYFAAVIKPGP